MTYDSLVIEADGGSRGNPGVAGYGALVRDPATGDVLAERAEPLGKVSNNVAEYRGLIAGLEAAALIDPDAPVLVRMDSKLVIEQMAGRWKIKHEDMKRLALQARSLVFERTGPVRWEWIPREKNKAADKLSNDGMDGRTVVRDLWREAPDPRDAPVGAPVSTARVLLVRHGAADANGLTQAGVRQAEQAAAAIASFVQPPVLLVTAATPAAIRTGEAIARELRLPAPDSDTWDDGVPAGAELARLVSRRHGEEIIVLVAGAEVVLDVLGEVLGVAGHGVPNVSIAPGSLSGVEIHGDERVVAFLNDTHHLRSAR